MAVSRWHLAIKMAGVRDLVHRIHEDEAAARAEAVKLLDAGRAEFVELSEHLFPDPKPGTAAVAPEHNPSGQARSAPRQGRGPKIGLPG